MPRLCSEAVPSNSLGFGIWMRRGKEGCFNLGLGSSLEGKEPVGMGTVCGTPVNPRARGRYLEVEGGRRWEKVEMAVGGPENNLALFALFRAKLSLLHGL